MRPLFLDFSTITELLFASNCLRVHADDPVTRDQQGG